MSTTERHSRFNAAVRGLAIGIAGASIALLGVISVTRVLNDYNARTEVTPWAGPKVNANASTVAQQVKGKTVKEADKIITAAGLRSRIVSVDGVPNIVTADFVDNRINLDISDGVVTGTSIG